MKKLIGILLAATVVLMSFSVTVFAVNEKKSVEIYCDAGASETVKKAADVLKKYIGQLPGNEVEQGAVSDCSITLVGSLASDKNPDGSYTIKGNSERTEIVGYGHNGIMYAGYDFLREYGGYHDYAVATGMQTANEELVLPENINVEYTPAFDYTDTDWPASNDAEFASANGINGRLFRSYVDETGGSAGYISNFCHTLTTQFCASDKYFEKDPELFSFHEGRRTPSQLFIKSTFHK